MRLILQTHNIYTTLSGAWNSSLEGWWNFEFLLRLQISIYLTNWIFWELLSEEHKLRQSSLHLKVPFKSYIQYSWKKDFITFKIHILGAVFWLIAKRMIKSPQPPYTARWGINHSLMEVKKHYMSTLSLSIWFVGSDVKMPRRA